MERRDDEGTRAQDGITWGGEHLDQEAAAFERCANELEEASRRVRPGSWERLRTFEEFGEDVLLTVRCANILYNADITTRAALRDADLSQRNALRWRNCGGKALAILQAAQEAIRRNEAIEKAVHVAAVRSKRGRSNRNSGGEDG